MKLTDEQLQEIADKGAEAAFKSTGGREVDWVYIDQKNLSYGMHKQIRQAFTRTVIDLALAQLAGGEGDLVKVSDINGVTSFEADVAVINTRHRQAMAALRAQMQGAVDSNSREIVKWQAHSLELQNERDQWKERAAQAEAEVVELRVRDGRWFDKDGCCRVCDGELPHGHTESCDIFKTGQEVTELRRQLARHEKELAALKQQAPADREALEGMLGATAKRDWVKCPICGERDMRREQDEEGNALILCVNHACGSNGGSNFSALTHKQPWIPCSERMPTREDANQEDQVLWVWTSLNDVVARAWNWTHANKATHWMPIPPLPTAPTAEKAPTPPEGFHIATEEELDCLPGQPMQMERGGSPWWLSNYTKTMAVGGIDRKCRIYACPNTPPLVTFTSGKINPPPYGSWHRSDWSPEMLPDGWRPLLLGEVIEASDEMLFDGTWISGSGRNAGGLGHFAHAGGNKRRTKRPLPPPAPEKEPEWVPLEACDVPPGSAIRYKSWASDSTYIMASPNRFSVSGALNGNLVTIYYQEMLEKGCEISRDNGKTWEACKKIKQP